MNQESNASLSEREIEVLRLLATGATNKEIAGKLVISPNTVKVHLRNIYAKIEVASRTEASMWAVQHGVLDFGLASAEQEEETLPLAEAGEGAGESPPPRGLSPRRALPTPLVWGMVALMLVLALGSAFLLRGAVRGDAPSSTALPQNAGEEPLTRWQPGAALPEPAWGMAASAYDGRIYLFGGQEEGGLLARTLRYDPRTAAWERMAPKPTPVRRVSAALLGEKIYLPGGEMASGEITDVLEIYDPRQDAWTQGASLPAPRSAVALAAFEGRLYLFGGWDGSAYAADVWVYDPQADAWETLTPMSQPRLCALAVATDNGIHLLGGENAGAPLDLHEIYAPAREGSPEGPWRSAPALPRPLKCPVGGGVANLVYVFASEQEAASGWLFAENSDTWNTLDTPPQPLGEGTTAVPLGAYLHFVGGRRGEHWVYQAVYVVSIPAIQR